MQSIVEMYKEVRQTAADNAPGSVLAPRGTIATLWKKVEAGSRDPAREGLDQKSWRDTLKDGQVVFVQGATPMKHGLEDLKAERTKEEGRTRAEQQKLSKAREEKDHTAGVLD